jgi:hypothetical protein
LILKVLARESTVVELAEEYDAGCQLRLLLYSSVVVSGRGRRHRAPERRPADPVKAWITDTLRAKLDTAHHLERHRRGP